MTSLKAVQHPIETLPIAAKVSIPGSPDWVGIGPDAVWILNKARNSLARIEPASEPFDVLLAIASMTQPRGHPARALTSPRRTRDAGVPDPGDLPPRLPRVHRPALNVPVKRGQEGSEPP